MFRNSSLNNTNIIAKDEKLLDQIKQLNKKIF
jgi:hypothetical protein